MIKVITAHDAETFEKKVNEQSAIKKPFAVQTSVTAMQRDGYLYTAVMYYAEEAKQP